MLRRVTTRWRNTAALSYGEVIMRIGILSDTHNQADRTRQAIELLLAHEAEAIFHCGDFTDAAILQLCALKPCYFVFGNNDSDTVPDLRQASESSSAVCLGWGGEVTLDGRRIAVTHGHLRSEVRPLLDQHPDFLFTGHSHIPDDHQDGPTRRINPGALHRAAKYTVAVLDLSRDHLEFLEVRWKRETQ
ncbi:MAG: metallophosphoesterase family protein [Planctomycetaceae bacterium]